MLFIYGYSTLRGVNEYTETIFCLGVRLRTAGRHGNGVP